MTRPAACRRSRSSTSPCRRAAGTPRSRSVPRWSCRATRWADAAPRTASVMTNRSPATRTGRQRSPINVRAELAAEAVEVRAIWLRYLAGSVPREALDHAWGPLGAAVTSEACTPSTASRPYHGMDRCWRTQSHQPGAEQAGGLQHPAVPHFSANAITSPPAVARRRTPPRPARTRSGRSSAPVARHARFRVVVP